MAGEAVERAVRPIDALDGLLERNVHASGQRIKYGKAIGVNAKPRKAGGARVNIGMKRLLANIDANSNQREAGGAFHQNASDLAAVHHDVVGPLDAARVAGQEAAHGTRGCNGAAHGKRFRRVIGERAGDGNTGGVRVFPGATESTAAGRLSPSGDERANGNTGGASVVLRAGGFAQDDHGAEERACACHGCLKGIGP